jgi:TetR/AcrR family transcriptional repressor of mexJK operon
MHTSCNWREALMNRATHQWLPDHGLEPNADRRREILRVAFTVFAENGYSGATMLDIARRAHASKETLYAWFQNKEKLFETLLFGFVSEITARLPNATVDAPEPEIFLPTLAEAILRVTTTPDWIALIRITIAEAPRFPELRNIMAHLFMSRDGLIAYFNRCRSCGLMEFEDATEAVGLFISMVDGDWPDRLLFGMIDAVSDESIVAHAALVSRLFLRAVAPRTVRRGSPGQSRLPARKRRGPTSS